MTGPTRLGVPDEFAGPHRVAIITTYNADLTFFERQVLRSLPHTRHRIVLADDRRLREELVEAARDLNGVNRTYLAAGVQASGAAHAKVIMLLGEASGTLLVGSGNLSVPGYSGQGEAFTRYRWRPDDPSHLNEFRAARTFIDTMVDRHVADGTVETRIAAAWQEAPWLLHGPSSPAATHLVHNLDRPLLDALVEAVDGRPVDELTIHAPFYDHSGQALRRVLDVLAPERVRVLVQARSTSVDPAVLAAVLAATDAAVEVHSVQAPVTATRLHAKYLVARCGAEHIALQGSANLSRPALLLSSGASAANIEAGVIIQGPRSTVEALLEGLEDLGAVDIDEMHLGLVDDGPDDELSPTMRIVDLVWSAPHLSGLLLGRGSGDVAPTITLAIAGLSISEDDVAWAFEPEDGQLRFTATFPAGVDPFDRVRVLSLEIDGTASGPLFPYHLRALRKLASTEGRHDLLAAVGDLGLEDDTLDELLVELDRVLVVDGRSLWRLARPGTPIADDGDGPHLNYDDLDLDALGRHAVLQQYRGSPAAPTDQTDLGLVLSSIAERFRIDADIRLGRATDAHADPETAGEEPPAEDEAEADADAEGRERRQISAQARAAQQWKRFLRRFVDGIADPAYVEIAGSSVIVPSYAIFGHLCLRLDQRELVDADELVQLQLAMWEFFWGTEETPGYLASLGEAERMAALDLLDRHHAEAVLLTTIDRHWWDLSDDGETTTRWRDLFRRVLADPNWQPTATAVEDAAAFATDEPATTPDPVALVGRLEMVPSFHTARELVAEVARALGSTVSDLRWDADQVVRGGQRVTEEFLRIDPSAPTPDGPAVNAAMTAWQHIDGERTYFRIAQTGGFVAIVDLDTHLSFAVWPDDSEQEIAEPDDVAVEWATGLELLRRLAA